MQVDTAVAEADVGKLAAEMPATFTVDAYPARELPRHDPPDPQRAADAAERRHLRRGHRRRQRRAEAEAGHDRERDLRLRRAARRAARAERGAALPPARRAGGDGAAMRRRRQEQRQKSAGKVARRPERRPPSSPRLGGQRPTPAERDGASGVGDEGARRERSADSISAASGCCRPTARSTEVPVVAGVVDGARVEVESADRRRPATS